jgi:hypothetical protein
MMRILLATAIALCLTGAARADYVAADDPLMQRDSLKRACLSRIKRHIGDPGSMRLVQYGGYRLAWHDERGSPERKWIPIRISFQDSDGHRVQGDWVCSFRIRNGVPADLVAFVQ